LYWPGSKANVYGGLITGGQAPYGGNIGVPTAGRNNGYAVNNCEIAIHGGTVQNGVATVPGTAFLCDTEADTQYFRINYSTPTDEQIISGVEKLGKFIKEFI